MTYSEKLKTFGQRLASIGGKVYHYWRASMQAPYTVWQEDGAPALQAENDVAELGLSGTVDYFTREEYDPMVDRIMDTFRQLPIFWELESVQYEEDTKLIHYEWRFRWL